MQKTAVLFLGLAMSIASFGISTVHASGAATFSLSPTNTSVDTGDSFSLSVLIDPSGESLDTARVEIEFDAALLEVTAFDLGSLFPYVSPSSEIDNTAGELSQGAFKFGTAVTSSGTFGTVTFRALSSGAATISVTSDSRLISDGVEKINTSSLGSATISIDGAEVEAIADEVTTDESSSGSGSSSSASLEEQALVYFGAFYARMPSNANDWAALHCIAYGGCQGDPRNVDAEAAALVIYGAKYGAMPATSMEWNVVHTLAYTDFLGESTQVVSEETSEVAEVVVEEEVVEEEVATEEEVVVEEVEEVVVETDVSLEAQALVYFGAFYARMPSSSNDWEALHCIAYGGCQGDPRDLVAEQNALILFGQKYAKMPATSMEWNVLHTIAYTDLLTYDMQGDEEEVVEEIIEEVVEEVVEEVEEVVEEVVEEEVVEELTVEQQAIGWFGQLTGALPSSDADWTAVDYIVNGYTPETQDLEAESAAITTFVSTFGALPGSDQDWNIVAAIAYSGAF